MRVTPEQFEWRKENRITGAYVSNPPRGERRGRKAVKPSCENCGTETDYLFAGFKSPNDARAKFLLNERVKLSQQGREQFKGMTRTGVVASFPEEPTQQDLIRIRVDLQEQPTYWHIDFWEPAKDRRALVALCASMQTIPAMVCQRCRPPSNLEVREILAAAK